MSANLVLIGDKLRLYKAMAQKGPITPEELAKSLNAGQEGLMPKCLALKDL